MASNTLFDYSLLIDYLTTLSVVQNMQRGMAG
jgi:hypothetical protein